MVLGVTRREREALRADKAWTSVWHRQMLNFQRGLTNDKTDAITNGPKPIHGISMIKKENTNEH